MPDSPDPAVFAAVVLGFAFYGYWSHPYGYAYGAYPYGAYSHYNPYWRSGWYGYGYAPYGRW